MNARQECFKRLWDSSYCHRPAKWLTRRGPMCGHHAREREAARIVNWTENDKPIIGLPIGIRPRRAKAEGRDV